MAGRTRDSNAPLTVVSFVARRAVVADEAFRSGGGASGTEVVARHFKRTTAPFAGVRAAGAGVAVEAGSAGVALRSDRVVQARAAGAQIVGSASGRVTVALAGDAFELAEARAVAAHVAERAFLAGQSCVAWRANALFNSSRPFCH